MQELCQIKTLAKPNASRYNYIKKNRMASCLNRMIAENKTKTTAQTRCPQIIRRDADLVQILKAVDIDEEIPVEAFAAVAEIISYVYQVNNKQLPET